MKLQVRSLWIGTAAWRPQLDSPCAETLIPKASGSLNNGLLGCANHPASSSSSMVLCHRRPGSRLAYNKTPSIQTEPKLGALRSILLIGPTLGYLECQDRAEGQRLVLGLKLWDHRLQRYTVSFFVGEGGRARAQNSGRR